MTHWPQIHHGDYIIRDHVMFSRITDKVKRGNSACRIILTHHHIALEAMEALAAVLDRYMKERAK